MRVAPFAAMSAGAVIFYWSAGRLGWRRACGLKAEPRRPEDPELVLGGPFRIVRHPQSLAAILVLLGIGISRATPAAYLGAAVASAAVALLARRSERALGERFGDAYGRYQRAVPFLIPGMRRMLRSDHR